jgi:gliding motility-associated-like protein
VRRTSADPCYAAATVTITESAPEITASFTTTSATCQGSDGSITIIPGGTYTYELDATPVTPVANVISNVAGGNHIVTAFDAVTGCARSFPVTVSFPGFVTYSAPATTIDATCSTKGTIGLFIPNPPGSYEIGFTTDPLNQPTNYNSAFYNPATGLVIIGNLEGGTYYVWIRTSATSCPTRFENSPGVYEVVIGGPQSISFEVGCRYSDDDNDGLAVLDLNNISATSTDPIFYEIFGNGFQKSGQITPNAMASDTIHGFATGDYVVWLRQDQSTFGCTVYSDTLDAPSGALDTLSLITNVSFPDQPTGSVQVKIQESGAEPYEAWLVEAAFRSDTLTAARTPVVFEVNFNSLAAATYTLYIEDAEGCRKQYDVVLPFDDSIFVPNIFTPNNDGINENFYVRNLPASGTKLSITNRWGKEVYSSGNYNTETLWDGGGAPDGVYYYRLQISGGGTYTGWVEIVRGVKP